MIVLLFGSQQILELGSLADDVIPFFLITNKMLSLFESVVIVRHQCL